MKLLFIFIFIIILSCSSSTDEKEGKKDQELTFSETVDTGTDQTLNKIHFINDSVGFIVGGNAYPSESAIVLKTSDFGNTWKKVYEKSGYYLNAISSNSTNLFAVSNDGRILISDLTGNNWSEHKQVGFYYLSDITFSNINIAYAVGSSYSTGIVFQSIDGGTSWKKLDLDTSFTNNNIYTSIHIVNDTSIFITGGIWSKGKILKSHDSGSTWELDVISNLRINDLSMKGELAFTVGHNGITNPATEKGKIFKSMDFGKTWSEILTGYTNKLESIAIQNNNICVIGANISNNLIDPEFVMVSVDAGNNWFRIKHDYVVAGWNDVQFISDRKILLIGHSGRAIIIEIKK